MMKKQFYLQRSDSREVVLHGLKGNSNEIQACLGPVMLDYIDEKKKERNILSDTYKNCSKEVEGTTFLKYPIGLENSYQCFVIRIDEKTFRCAREYVYNRFKEYNIFTRKYFYPLRSEYTCYRQLSSSKPLNLPVAPKVVKEVLSLPLYGQLSVEDVYKICEILKSFGCNKS